MAYNSLKYLEDGKVDFIFDLSSYDYKSLIEKVRNSSNKLKIIKGFFPLLCDKLPYFCFEVVRDIEEYKTFTYNYCLNNFKINDISKDTLNHILNESVVGKRYLEDNFELILLKYQDDLDFIFDYLFKNVLDNYDLLKRISIYSNLHIRSLFMIYLIKNYKEISFLFYDDISKYLTSLTYEENEQLSLFEPLLMKMEDLSYLAFVIFDENYNYDLYLKIKKILFDNYKTNNLVSYLLKPKKEMQGETAYTLVPNYKGIKEVRSDIDTYFKTANKSRFVIYKNFTNIISEELRSKYEEYLSYFRNKDGSIEYIFNDIDNSNLGIILEKLVDKYLSLSKNDIHYYIGKGSTSYCYRIGDYVFKLDRTKWSFEEIICPDLYIILPNLEEMFIRDKNGIITSGIEVQKYLEKDAKDVPKNIVGLLRRELKKLGYYTTDSFMDGPCGDNCRLLDSYIDSGNLNPPDWFKEYPLVLVDRDRVYKLENKNPKQLSSTI